MSTEREAFMRWWNATHNFPFNFNTEDLYEKHAYTCFIAGYRAALKQRTNDKTDRWDVQGQARDHINDGWKR